MPADVLLTTLYFTVAPTEYFDDISTTGGGVTHSITAAESHDGSDTTYFEATTLGDGAGLNGEGAYILSSGTHTTSAVTEAISFLRIKARARVTGTGGSATIQPAIASNLVGSSSSATGSYANYAWDIHTNPATGLAWTNAAINSADLGVGGSIYFDDAYSPGSCIFRVSEFSIELWGSALEWTAPATGDGVDATGVPGDMTSDGGTSEVGASVSSVIDAAGTLEFSFDLRDPAAVVPLAATIDSVGGEVKTVRSNNATLNDQSTATKTTTTSPASWPSSGTFSIQLGGVQGATAIHGEGAISGVKCFALIRASASTGATLNTFRFGTAMGIKTLVAQPNVYDAGGTLTDEMFAVVESSLITVGAFNNAFTWGNGVDSVWANFVSPTWTLRAAYSVTTNPQIAKIEIAEAWIEIHGPLGADDEPIAVRQVMGSHRKIMTLNTEL